MSELAIDSEERPQQAEIAFARIKGQPCFELPRDLYIPPEALEVFLEAFEGPLDLLLYLIRRQNLDILDVPLAQITEQYVQYIDMMREFRLELAAEYLVMAAILAEIKSRMLLPRPHSADADDERDPRAELIRRLQEYERFKKAAADIDELPRMDRDRALLAVHAEAQAAPQAPPAVDLREMLLALASLLRRAELHGRHAVSRERLSVRARMSDILDRLRQVSGFQPFNDLFDPREGRHGLVVTFLAVLELVREQLLDLIQSAPREPLYVQAVGVEA